MLTRFVSEPASQYCSVRKYARTSCALPGMNRRILGIRRSMRICCAPVVPLPGLPRSRFSRASGPVLGPPIAKPPSRVSRVTSPADITPMNASHCGCRAFSASSTGMKWSSMNSITAMMMSALAMSSRQSASAASLSPHSAAACSVSCIPG